MTPGLHYIAQDIEAETDWPLLMRWLAVWPLDPSSRPVGPCMSGQALTTTSRPATWSTPTGRVPQ